MKPRFSHAIALFAALVLSLLQACTTIRHIRDAQDAFNDAARAEIEFHANGIDASGADLIGAPAAAGYKVALGLVDRELKDNSGDLDGDNLMGAALTLRALCIWRLWDLGEGDASSAGAGNENKPSAALDQALDRIHEYGVEKLGTRDRVLYYALPGLHDHDRALRAKDWVAQEKLFESAITVTDDALVKVAPPENHPIRGYIALAQLSTCRAWQWAAYRSTDSLADRDTRTQKPHDVFEKKLLAVRPLWQGNDRFFKQIEALCQGMGVTVPKR